MGKLKCNLPKYYKGQTNMRVVKKTNYTSATGFPAKLLQCKDAVKDGKIIPYHLQLSPTNRCNGNCRWCSCRDVNRSEEMPIEEINEIAEYFYKLGSRAVSIIGGGEPTIHKKFPEIVDKFYNLGYDLGMATNGIHWSKTGSRQFDSKFVWVRISITDTESGKYPIEVLKNVSDQLPSVDLGISFTVTKDLSYSTLEEVCGVANGRDNFTHIRFVEDYTSRANIITPELTDLIQSLSDKAIIIFNREIDSGFKRCLMPQLRPLIDARGLVFPCCGVQYARDLSTYEFSEKDFSLGHWHNYENFEIFDGSKCLRCYYGNYIRTLETLIEPLKHSKFL